MHGCQKHVHFLFMFCFSKNIAFQEKVLREMIRDRDQIEHNRDNSAKIKSAPYKNKG